MSLFWSDFILGQKSYIISIFLVVGRVKCELPHKHPGSTVESKSGLSFDYDNHKNCRKPKRTANKTAKIMSNTAKMARWRRG